MKKILLICGVLASLFSTAQRDLPEVDDNLSKYLDDGKNTDPEGDIRLALSSSFSGFFEVMYEHKITNSIGLEAIGAAKVWRGVDFWDRLIAENNYYPDTDTFTGGFGYGANFKWYPNEDAICDMAYYGVGYRGRVHNNTSSVYKTHDIMLSLGVKYLISNSISADVALSMGPRFYNYAPDKIPDINDPNVYYTIDKYKGTMFYGGVRFGFGYYINYKK